MFFCNGFDWDRVGEERKEYIIRKNIYCQVRYIKEKRAFVIVSADSKEDAIKGNLKIWTEYYYMDEPEKAMLHRLDEDVMTNYMKWIMEGWKHKMAASRRIIAGGCLKIKYESVKR